MATDIIVTALEKLKQMASLEHQRLGVYHALPQLEPLASAHWVTLGTCQPIKEMCGYLINTIHYDIPPYSNQWWEFYNHVTCWLLSCGLWWFLVIYETTPQALMLCSVFDPPTTREGGLHTWKHMVNTWVHWGWGTCLDYCCSIICHLHCSEVESNQRSQWAMSGIRSMSLASCT